MATRKNNILIKAVIFDIGSVLMKEKNRSGFYRGEYVKGLHEYLAKQLGISIDKWFDAIDTPYGKSFVGEISEKEAIKQISLNLGISQKRFVNLYLTALKKNFEKNQLLYTLARDLKKRGFIIGILSDQWALSKKAVMDKETKKLFDPIIISCDVRMRKPHPRIYKLLLRKLKEKDASIKFKNILFIDDKPINIREAKKLGIRAILFKTNEDLIKKLNSFGIGK